MDRLDNSKGYTTDNTVIMCYQCNTLKSTWDSPTLMAKFAQSWNDLLEHRNGKNDPT